MIVILSSSSWSDLLQNEVSQIFKRIDMTKDDITLQLGERWAEALKKYFGNSKYECRKINITKFNYWIEAE